MAVATLIAKPVDEVEQARSEVLAMAMRDLLKLIERTAFLWPKEQEVLARCEALVVETLG